NAALTEIHIGTVAEKMRYTVKEFSVKAGKKLKLTFANSDFMPHNIVFVKPGTADQVGMAAMQLGAKGFEMQFVPENENIITSSGLVDNGKEVVLEFTAPAEPGDYQFVCTFPGHHLLMRGVMHVTR
ncbi:MAG TPA: plastocyanin/azurin family copper-binding protein, partial [Verrucomicrobiae bacterium]|nr:plastocyanin/azurin family copper-binding protein [Verrucomicrobiae bacterium]